MTEASNGRRRGGQQNLREHNPKPPDRLQGRGLLAGNYAAEQQRARLQPLDISNCTWKAYNTDHVKDSRSVPCQPRLTYHLFHGSLACPNVI
jgi:hypothetical protein